jgi:hypothetical protein
LNLQQLQIAAMEAADIKTIISSALAAVGTAMVGRALNAKPPKLAHMICITVVYPERHNLLRNGNFPGGANNQYFGSKEISAASHSPNDVVL